MPPRQRKATGPGRPREEGTQQNAASSEEKSRTERQGEQQRVKKKEVSWTPVFKTIGIFFLIILIPTLLNYASLKQEARMLVPTGGTLYDIGWKQRILLKCTGTGLPTVILDAPIGQSSDVWALVEPLIAKKTKVCVYDRAGLGFSDRAYQNTSLYSSDYSAAAQERDRTMPSTVERMTDDLHRLVSYASNQPKPLLLVSFDFSTFVSRFYTQLYEHEVAGLLLVDPAPETIFDSKDQEPEKTGSENEESTMTWYKYFYKRMIPHAQGLWLSAVIGFNRLSLMVGYISPLEEDNLATVLPKEVVTRRKHLLCNPKHLSSVLDEYFYMNESMHQMKTILKVKPFPHQLPVVIATYEKVEQSNLEPELIKVWISGQDHLRQKVHPESRHVVLPGTDYLTLYTHPKILASVVLTMVEQWRKESKLSA